MEKIKLDGVKFPGYPTKEIARDIENFLTTQGIFFESPETYRKEADRLGHTKIVDPEPLQILIELKEC